MSVWKGGVGKGDFPDTTHTNHKQPLSQLLAASDVVCGYEVTVPIMNL